MNDFRGISLGSIYAIIALGYTMVYGIAKMLNFAHGDVIMVGAYICFYAISSFNLPPREFGSGGRTVGKKLAQKLQIPCYDQEIIEKIAAESGFAEDYIRDRSEYSPHTSWIANAFSERSFSAVLSWIPAERSARPSCAMTAMSSYMFSTVKRKKPFPSNTAVRKETSLNSTVRKSRRF